MKQDIPNEGVFNKVFTTIIYVMYIIALIYEDT